MKKIFLSVVLSVAAVAAPANVFFTGQNQSPQIQRMPQGPSPMALNQNQWQQPNQWAPQQAPRPGQFQQQPAQWGQMAQPGQQRTFQQQQMRPQPAPVAQNRDGFFVTGGASYQMAHWRFDMNSAGSILEYNNITWSVLDLGGGYRFNTGGTSLQINAGMMFGTQMGSSSMIDDDITNGGSWMTYLVIPPGQPNAGDIIGEVFVDAISVGRTSGGSKFGYHLSISFPDNFQIGNARLVPEIGWRHTQYRLRTRNNVGMVMTVVEGDVSSCFPAHDGFDEVRCHPMILVANCDPRLPGCDPQLAIVDNLDNVDGWIVIGGNYWFAQPGTSHDYRVEWAGPFIALGVEYEMNHNNSVDFRVELGFPGYRAVGAQPYRVDWRSRNPIEDNAGIGSAMHIGLAANWNTAISNSTNLSFGFTYDRFTVSDARATTRLNPGWFTTENGFTQTEINAILADCPNFVCVIDNEVNSSYRTMGARVGLTTRF